MSYFLIPLLVSLTNLGINRLLKLKLLHIKILNSIFVNKRPHLENLSTKYYSSMN
jgi:hypothetical protein